MTKKQSSYYWDTSVFLAVIKGETCHGPGVLEGAVNILEQVRLGTAVVITSTVTITEILPGKYKDEPTQWDKWESILQIPQLLIRDVDFAVARKARELRNLSLLNKKADQKVLQFADAVHVATALIYQPTAIHCLDDRLHRVLARLNLTFPVERPYLAPLHALPTTGLFAGYQDEDQQ